MRVALCELRRRCFRLRARRRRLRKRKRKEKKPENGKRVARRPHNNKRNSVPLPIPLPLPSASARARARFQWAKSCDLFENAHCAQRKSNCVTGKSRRNDVCDRICSSERLFASLNSSRVSCCVGASARLRLTQAGRRCARERWRRQRRRQRQRRSCAPINYLPMAGRATVCGRDRRRKTPQLVPAIRCKSLVAFAADADVDETGQRDKQTRARNTHTHTHCSAADWHCEIGGNLSCGWLRRCGNIGARAHTH